MTPLAEFMIIAGADNHPPMLEKNLYDWKQISEKRTKNQAKTDKTEHGMEEREKTKSKSKPETKKSKSKFNPEKSTVKIKAVIEEMINGPTRTDKAKIPRKRIKPGKLEHGNGRATLRSRTLWKEKLAKDEFAKEFYWIINDKPELLISSN
ncbi:hypothetical protein Tco_0894635 [Tanacetum coccineum]|uniref:Uncharacterized protein n=1 Tax=Tanacetum coccineum TaxID=301880 RepID=A0ABQ5CDK4_9ASTR